MAELLKRQYDLIVLKVRLAAGGDEPRIVVELEVKDNGEPVPVRTWQFAAAAFGVPARLDRRATRGSGYAFAVPADLIAGLKDWIQANHIPGTPLWIHLVKPYGYLGMLPWERLLQQELGVPLLRLPDFVVQPPRETPSTLDVLLCSSVPVAKEDFPVVEQLAVLVERLRDAVPRRTRFHVFTDGQVVDQARSAFERRGLLGTTVTIYPPDQARAYAVPETDSDLPDRSDRLSNPWLLWMRQALAGRSIDVAHFVCHGYLAHDRGALALAESPLVNQDAGSARFVGTAELRSFLTQIGAWSSIFSSPPRNYSEMGLRQLADTIAQLRPGPVVHHEIALDQEGAALAGAYKLLFSGTPEQPPPSPALFIYCQPFRVKTFGAATRGLTARSAPPVDRVPELDAYYAASENVPAWVAASERYVEECELNLQKRRPEEGAAPDPSGDRERTTASLEQTLQQIRSVVARVAQSTRGGPQ
jgi:hypothetical protein